MDINILDILERTELNEPEHIGFADENREVTYHEIVNEAQKLGTIIADKGYKRRAVAVVMPKSVECLISYMGTLYSGNFYVPVDVDSPVERIKKIFETVMPIAIITFEKNKTLFSELYNVDVICYEDLRTTKVNHDILNEIRQKMIDTDPAYALFTSGSTGVPKGVVVCHRSVIDYSEWIIDTFKMNADSIFGSQAPFYFSMSVFDIYATIRSGGTLYIIPKSDFTFISDLIDYMQEKKINTIYWVPTVLCSIAQFKALDKVTFPYLKKVLFAGEVMPTKQLNYWIKNIPDALYANLFGPTEITDIGSYYILNRKFSDSETIPIGNACRNVRIIVLDQKGEEITEKNVVGELYFGGSFLAHGYYNNDERTSEAYVQNPLNPFYPEIIYKTGDLVKWNKYHELEYVSRCDNQIKHLGNRIELGEIDAAVGAIDGIDRCATIYDKDTDQIMLFYQCRPDFKHDLDEMIRNTLPTYMVPSKKIRLNKMPINSNGKIDRLKLQKMCQNSENT